MNDGDVGGSGVANDFAEHITGVDPRAVNRLLSNELNQLSLNHREQILEEIHGVKADRGVSLQSSSGANNQLTKEREIVLKKIEEELDEYYFSERNQMTTNAVANDQNDGTDRNYRYPAYMYARENGSELIRDRDFQRTFVGRGEGGKCPKKGATRMLNYLELIREAFDTNEVLFRPICLSDLSEELGSKEFMYENAPLQFLPVRDPSGRRVLVQLRDFGPSSCPVLVRQQIGLYFLQSVIEDCEGIVFVLFLHHADKNIYHAEESRNFNRMMEAVPARFSAFHVCCPDGPLYEIMKAAVTLLIGKENRERLRLHVGSYQECKYVLRTFGIQVDRLPIELNSKGKNSKRKQYDLKYHKKWLDMRRAKESAMFAAIGRDDRGRIINRNNMDIGDSFHGVMAAIREIRLKYVECPRHEDCLFGKGRPTMYHPGNIGMRKLLQTRIARFEAMMPLKKSSVVWEVVNEIKRGTGRFLKEDTDHAGIFVITDDATAFKKIAIAFRDLKKRRLQNEEQRYAIGNSKQSLEQDMKKINEAVPMGRQRKRFATSAEALALKETSVKRNMSGLMDKKVNVEIQCFPFFAANDMKNKKKLAKEPKTPIAKK